MKLRTILVPLDGSPLAETALPRAVDLAGTSGARLILLRAVEARTLPGLGTIEAQVRIVAEGEKYLKQIADRLQAEGVETVETSLWYGPAAYAIVEAVQRRGIDLIVMTSHGRSGLGRLILGSVAESVLRGTRTPILLLRDEDAPVDEPRASALAGPAPVSPSRRGAEDKR